MSSYTFLGKSCDNCSTFFINLIRFCSIYSEVYPFAVVIVSTSLPSTKIPKRTTSESTLIWETYNKLFWNSELRVYTIFYFTRPLNSSLSLWRLAPRSRNLCLELLLANMSAYDREAWPPKLFCSLSYSAFGIVFLALMFVNYRLRVYSASRSYIAGVFTASWAIISDFLLFQISFY
jgi:hypothetical protein